jgi:predicted metalloprotease
MGMMMFVWPLIRPLLRTKTGWLIIGIGALLYFSGFNPLKFVGMDSSSGTTVANKAEDDKQATFISTVLSDTEHVWQDIFMQTYGKNYTKPQVVLYRGSTHSGCGGASAEMGPFYCPTDAKVYVDLGFFDELAQKHGATGDFTKAYVLAHEIGHHIQNLQGTLDKAHSFQASNSKTDSNAVQVRIELQADCYSGVWANQAQKRYRMLEAGDIEEALNAASAIGDDVLQKQAQGYVSPDSFTHGSAAQRSEWFKRGFEQGTLEACNTFK